jgi:hypothetical protein
MVDFGQKNDKFYPIREEIPVGRGTQNWGKEWVGTAENRWIFCQKSGGRDTGRSSQLSTELLANLEVL